MLRSLKVRRVVLVGLVVAVVLVLGSVVTNLSVGSSSSWDYTALTVRDRVGIGTTSPEGMLEISSSEGAEDEVVQMTIGPRHSGYNGSRIQFLGANTDIGEMTVKYDHSRQAILSLKLHSGTGYPEVLRVEGKGLVTVSGGIKFPDGSIQTTAATGGGAGTRSGCGWFYSGTCPTGWEQVDWASWGWCHEFEYPSPLNHSYLGAFFLPPGSKPTRTRDKRDCPGTGMGGVPRTLLIGGGAAFCCGTF